MKIKEKLLKKPLIVREKKQVIALKYFATGEITDEEYAKLIEGREKFSSAYLILDKGSLL